MENYKIVVQYDGSRYKGWQVQKSTGDTIQGKLQEILSTLSGEDVEVIGSGRTDAGVHAKGQVANFHINLKKSMTEKELLIYINEKLPDDIAVISLEKAEERFHARFNAVEKTYRYRLYVSPIADVFEKKFVYTFLEAKLDVKAMKKAAEFMVGKQDFKAFCGNKHMKKSTVREVKEIKLTEIKDENGLKEIDIDYTGDGFLQNMIRIMTGTLLEVGMGKRKPESVKEIIESGNRENAGYTAPPQGLCLMNVNY